MPTLWIAVLTLAAAASPQVNTESTTLSAADSSPSAGAATDGEKTADGTGALGSPIEKFRKLSGRELLDATRETLARLARPEDEQLEAAVEELLFVYQELQEDRDMAGSQRASYQAKVQIRLRQLGDQLKKRIARNKRLSKSKTPDRIRGREQIGEYLGQRVGGAAPPAPPLVGGGRAGPRGQMPNDDYGQHLVDLIQKTIAPESWDVNGGLGTIFYWRPGRALVVRQTGEVHGEMGGVLDQLRRAGP